VLGSALIMGGPLSARALSQPPMETTKPCGIVEPPRVRVLKVQDLFHSHYLVFQEFQRRIVTVSLCSALLVVHHGAKLAA
jgi:hypothetical protein